MNRLAQMAFVFALAAWATWASAADLYVSPDGADASSGTSAAEPFATLGRAQQQVRQLRQADPDDPITISLRAGRYAISQPLVLTPEDSGSADAPVTYAAQEGESPVISGGRVLTGWTVRDDGRWTLHLPEVERGDWSFSQLFVDGHRRTRPRMPDDGYAFIAGQVASTARSAGKGWDRFRYHPGDIDAGWRNLSDVEVLAFHSWSMSRLRIDSVDDNRRVVTFTGPSPNIADWAALRQGDRYIVENVAEALDEPGEWYLDRPTGVLTYIPMPGETPESVEVVAPLAEALVVIQGDPENARFVEHVTFRGIAFEHTNWVAPPEGYSFVQAELPMRGAIRAEGARSVSFESCAVRHVGGYGMEWGPGCQRNRVERCDLTDLGAGGIRLGDASMREDDRFAVTHNVIRDNLIAHGGRTHPAGIGVLITHAAHNTVEHNVIADFYYSAISAGWSWGYAPTVTHHNTIAHNHMHDLGQGVLSDMGGVYTLGVSPGTTIRGNVMHDVRSHTYGGWGIYFDEGSTGILAADNLVYRTRSAPFHQHYGRDNRVENNILAFGGEAQLMRTRAEDHFSFTLERNIVYWTDPESPLLGSNWTGDTGNFRLDHNLYWHGGHPVTFNGASLDEWRATGQDENSVVADPRFIDPANGDFRLADDSPADQIGFVPFDQGKAGLLTRAGRELGSMPPAFPLDPGPPPPMTIFDDFEDTAVGDKALGATASEESDVAIVRVTDERAASGRHSLKFADAPGQQHSFNPHLYYRPGHETGTVAARFSLWLEPGTPFAHEWRTWPSGGDYKPGPSISIAPDGTLTAAGRALGKVPHRQWLTIEIVCRLGDAADRYVLRVSTREGRQLVAEPALPVSDGFRSLDWFGFTSNAIADAAFYLDDLTLQPRRR